MYKICSAVSTILAMLSRSREQAQKEHHYDWYKTTSVSVSGTRYPIQKKTFTAVSIVKKSFGGSESKEKPSLKLKFSRMTKKAEESATQAEIQESNKNGAAILALIGTKHLTFNNCKQDASYVRQPLGYEMFRQAGIPYARCNFAKVIVNNKNMGIYVNLEQAREPHLSRNFGNDKGNLYETEWRFDLVQENIEKGFSQEGFSPYKDQKDLQVAIPQLVKKLDTTGATKPVIDLDQLTRVMAVQTAVKHWDGYPNNTYVYNDMVGVETPDLGNVQLKLIPSGIDGIFYPDKPFKVKNEGVLTNLVFNDQKAKALLQTKLQETAKVFDTNRDANVQLLGKMADLLKSASVDKVEQVLKEIEVVKKEVVGVKAGLDAIVL